MHWLRRLVRGLLFVVIAVISLAGAAVTATQTAWFRNWLRQYVTAEANTLLNGRLEIGRLTGNLFQGVTLENVTVTVGDTRVASVASFALEYNALHFIRSGITIDRLIVDRPELVLRHDATGWSIDNLVKKTEVEADRQGPSRTFAVDAVEIAGGSVVIEDLAPVRAVHLPHRIDDLQARMSFAYEPVHYSLQLSDLSFRASDPSLVLRRLSGGFAVREDTIFLDHVSLQTADSAMNIDGAIHDYLAQPRLELKARSDRISLSEIGRLVPSIARDLAPSLDVGVNGAFDQLAVVVDTRAPGVWAKGRFVVDAVGPDQSLDGELSVRHLDLSPIAGEVRYASDINADVTAHLKAVSLADVYSYDGHASTIVTDSRAMGYQLEAGQLDADISGRSSSIRAKLSGYGASVTADGVVSVSPDDSRLAYTLHGLAQRVNLRRLPLKLSMTSPPVTELGGRYQATGSEPLTGSSTSGTRSLSLRMTLADSVLPGARIAAGTSVSLDIQGGRTAYGTNATLTGVNLRELAQAFEVPALTNERYESAIDAQVTAQGEGTSLGTLRLTAQGSVTDAAVLGGHLSLSTFATSVDHERATVNASGTITDLDPSVVSQRPALHGQTGGQFDITAVVDDVSASLGPDNVNGSLALTMASSSIGGFDIQSGALEASYRHNVADVRRLEMTGPGFDISGHGAVALDNEGSSDFALKASGLNLETLGQLVDLPAAGLAQADLHVTGNRVELRATGTIGGSEVKYGENGALALNSTVDVRVPELSLERAAISAETRATFVTIAGQEVNEVTGNIDYVDKRMSFDGEATQPERSLKASGALTLHPDHQEVHLTRLDLTTSGQTWQVPAGEEPTVHYSPDAIEITRLRLTDGDQTLEVDGRFGRPGDSLRVSATNVDLATVDAMLLRPPQFSGRLAASATIGGTWAVPEGRAQFQVARGGFKQFGYDSLNGAIELTGATLNVDARLQQNETQWLTATGMVPVAVFNRPPRTEGDGPTPHVVPGSTPNEFALVIDSSPVGLELVNGLTTTVTDVTGTAEMHLKVVGDASDPHPTGSITIANGAGRIPTTGVAYNHIAGRIDLQPDRVHIDQLTVLDNHQSALSITGDLAVHERDVGGVRIWINANDFHVFDNQLGDLRLESAIELGGQLTAPQLKGYLGVSTGRVNLDEILAKLGTPYGTQALDLTEGTEAGAGRLSPWDALQMDLRMMVPDDLVVRATDLQASGGSMGLGRLIVTLGGNLTASKEAGGPLRLVGDVQAIRGTYDFQGRRFDIVRGGTIRFDGLPELNPVLNLQLRREIQGVEARVNIRGTLREPALALSSTPPLEEADVLSLIVFNQPINQLGQGDQMSLAARAQSLAAGAVAGQIAQSIGSALNLDTFEIAVGPDSGSAAEVTLGQQLGRSLFLKVVQGVGDAATTNIVIEYEFLRWLRLQSNFQQGSSAQSSLFRRSQGTGADLIILFTK